MTDDLGDKNETSVELELIQKAYFEAAKRNSRLEKHSQGLQRRSDACITSLNQKMEQNMRMNRTMIQCVQNVLADGQCVADATLESI